MEGCGYRDLYADFQALGVEIIGVSFDDPSDNLDFAEEEGFQYELWSDAERTLAQYYGAASSSTQAFADRKTVILGWEGQLLLEYPVVSVGTSPADSLHDCELLFGG